MMREERGQVMLEFLLITIFVVVPMIILLAVIVKKLALIYSIADLSMKVPVL